MTMYGVCHRNDDAMPSIVLPWMENGNAREYFKNKPQSVDFENFVSLILSSNLNLRSLIPPKILKVGYGIAFLHSHKYLTIHGDIRGVRLTFFHARLHVLKRV